MDRASRGVAIGEGRVFVGLADGRLTALDQRTGAQLWQAQAERWEEGFAVTAAPLYFDGKVIMGFNGGELGTRGRLKAFDAKTGELAQRGVYKGPRLREFLVKVFGRGQEGPVENRLGNHLNLQPVIDVAADGKTAKVRARMLQQMSQGSRASMAGPSTRTRS